MSDWEPPSRVWPRHSRPQAQLALEEARRASWYLKKSSGRAKVWGVITCQDPDKVTADDRCSTSVMSTSGPEDGSETAKALRGCMRRCTHQRVVPAADAQLAIARSLLDAADRCLDIVDNLIRADSHRDLAMDFLDQCVTNTEEADRLLADAEIAERQQVLATAEAEETALAAGVGWPVDPLRTIAEAEELSSQALSALGDDRSRSARLLLGRAKGLRDRAVLLRRLL